MNNLALKKGGAPNSGKWFKFFTNKRMLNILILIATYAIIFVMIIVSISPKQYDLSVGDILDEPIKAPRNVEDKLLTHQRIEEAKQNVPAVYRLDKHISEEVIKELDTVFASIKDARNMAGERFRSAQSQQKGDQENEQQGDTGEKFTGEEQTKIESITDVLDDAFLTELEKKFTIQLSSDDLVTCITADENDMKKLYNALKQSLLDMLEFGIKKENLYEAKNTLRENIQALPLSNELKFLGTTIGGTIIQPNMLYDNDATEREKEKAAEDVEHVMYKKGQYIVQAGQPITQNQIEILRELGILKNQKMDMPLTLGIGLIIFVVMVIIAMHFVNFEKQLIQKPVMICVVGLILCLVIGICYVVSWLDVYLIPSAMAGMLITVLTGSQIALVINAALSILLGVMLDNQFAVVMTILLGGAMGIYISNNSQQRNNLVLAGLVAGLVNFAVIFSMQLISGNSWSQALNSGAMGVGGGLLSSVLTIGTLPIWENLFNIVTPIKLVELSDPNQPVLKRLLMEAPGTYHHSIIVANLAENAADAIGANGLLARVGAFYHDIGKLKRPYFFKENQLGDNPHDKIGPELSAHIITMHTMDGIDIAKHYKIPEVVHDFILQHHGTTPVIYFYHKAKEQNGEENTNLDDFRYSGPKPQTKEAAIVMMADMAEAAARSLSDPTPAKIEEFIRKLIRDRLTDGQLDECDLTLKDLDNIANAFVKVLCGIFHERIEYPNVNLEEEKIKSNASRN
ncbi:HD family phosphohydrolase [Xylanivirga thermophila]|uniref:HD family phosphohydrolase n=1 Tax=Xylanivirga thermophila TaxID=2496273 RepID=UPI00101D2560|nr:HDIG domain-containing metalloprotein [Xylanivirga thermophila]